MKRGQRGLMALAGLVVIAAIAWRLAPRPESPPAGETPATARAVSPTARQDPPPAMPVAGRGPDIPLPPPSAPLAETLPLLRARADAGDGRAACRLATELIRCQQAGEFPADMTPLEREYEAKGNLAAANHFAEQALWTNEMAIRCRDLPPDLRDRGGHYLRQAALAGDASAMLAYAEGMHWRLDGRGIALDPLFDRWRTEAPQMAQRALEAGLPAANYYFWMAYQDDFSLFGALVPDDPYRAYVHHLLMARLFGWREPDGTRRDLSPVELQRAVREADELHQRVYRGRRFRSAESMLQPLFLPPGPEARPGPCDEEGRP